MPCYILICCCLTIAEMWMSNLECTVNVLTFHQHLKTFLFSDALGLVPWRYNLSRLNYCPTFSGSWSDFNTWTTLKIHDWFIGWLIDWLLIDYDTIRDAILACARKLTWVGLIYHTETTTKNRKIEKVTSKNRYARSNGKSLRNHAVSPEEEKERLQWGGFAEKGFKSGMKERVGDEKLIIV